MTLILNTPIFYGPNDVEIPNKKQWFSKGCLILGGRDYFSTAPVLGNGYQSIKRDFYTLYSICSLVYGNLGIMGLL